MIFNKLHLTHNGDTCVIDLKIEAGGKYFITTNKSWVQKQLIGLMKRYEKPQKGELLLGDLSLYDFDTYELRQAINTLDRSLIVECSIEEYLRLANPRASFAEIRAALAVVELDTVVDALPNGVDSKVSVLGAPLQPLEFLLLKLAAVIIEEPKVLIINQHFDAIPLSLRLRLLARLSELTCTVLYFTNTPEAHCLDGVIYLEDRVRVVKTEPSTLDNTNQQASQEGVKDE